MILWQGPLFFVPLHGWLGQREQSVADDATSTTETFTKEQVAELVATEVAGLKANAAALLKEKKALADLAKKYEGIDPDAARTAMQAAEEAERKRAEMAGDWKAREAQLLEKVAANEKAKDATISSLSSALERRLVDAEATSALAAAKGSPKVLLPHIKAHVRVVQEDGEYVVQVVDSKGNQRIGDAKGSPMTIAQLVEEMKEDPDFARNFDGTGSSGGGASKSNGGAGGAVRQIASTNSPDFLANLSGIAGGKVKVG
jgi:hypothetical protein